MKAKRLILTVIIITLAMTAIMTSVVAIARQHAEEERLGKTTQAEATEKRLQGIIASMNEFPGSAGRDVLFLGSLSSVSQLVKASTLQNRQLAGEDLEQFAAKNDVYRQLYIFEGSQCAIQIETNRQSLACQTVPKQVANMLSDAQKAADNEVSVSPLTSITTDSDETVPALLYAARQGNVTVVTVVDANYFLEDVRRLNRDDEVVVLLDTAGGYLASPDKARELLMGGKGSLFNDYPGLATNVLATDTREVELGNKQFAFHRVYPTAGGFTLSGASKTGNNSEYYWVVATVSDAPQSLPWWRTNSYALYMGIIVVFQMIVVVLVGLIPQGQRSNSNKSHKKVQHE
jgi:hypothetical protein